MGAGGWKTPFSLRFGGGSHESVEGAYASIRDNLGDALSDDEDSVNDAETQCAARVLAHADARLAQFVAQSDPRALSDGLPRWEKILGIQPSRNDSLAARRARVASRLLTVYTASTDGIDAIAKAAFYPWTARAVYTTADNAVMYWPGGSSHPDFDWYSTVAHIVVEYYRPAWASDTACRKREAACIKSLDEFAPAWVTFDTHQTQTVGVAPELFGFFLDQPNIDVCCLDNAAAPWRSLYCTTFDGSNDYVDFGNVAALNFNLLSDPATFSLWFNGIGTTDTVISKCLGPPSYQGWFIRIESTGKLRIWAVNNYATNNMFYVSTPNNANTGQWKHAVIRVDGSGDGNGVSIDIDGTSVTPVVGTNSLTGTTANTGTVRIGGATAGWYFEGKIDDVAIWDSELTDDQVATTRKADGKPADLTHLSPLLWVQMGDGDVYPTITDHGSGGNDGTMTNMTASDIIPRT